MDLLALALLIVIFSVLAISLIVGYLAGCFASRFLAPGLYWISPLGTVSGPLLCLAAAVGIPLLLTTALGLNNFDSMISVAVSIISFAGTVSFRIRKQKFY